MASRGGPSLMPKASWTRSPPSPVSPESARIFDVMLFMASKTAWK